MLLLIIASLIPFALFGVEIACQISEERAERALNEKAKNEQYTYIDGRIHYL